MTRFNQAILAGASSIALFAGALTLITPAANAGMNCSTNSWGNTCCYGSGGSFNSSTNSWGNTNYYGSDNNGNNYSGSCSSDSWGNTTCY